MRHVYKQHFRPADNRDAVLVAKLSLEYRQLKTQVGGDERALLSNEGLANEVFRMKQRQMKVYAQQIN